MNVRDNQHFAELGEVPRIPAATPVRTVFERLSGVGAGGFLLVTGAAPSAYVVAERLAQRVLLAAKTQATDAAREAGAEKYTTAWVDAVTRLGNLSVGRAVREIAPMAVVPVSAQAVDASAGQDAYQGLQEAEDTVYRVHQGPQTVGWYLNHEHVRASLTQRIWFLCTNPAGPHRNPDMDHGRCRKCPYPLAETATVVTPAAGGASGGGASASGS